MNRLFTLLFAYLLLSSCSNDQRRLANEKNILGDWSIASFENKSYDGYSHPLPPTYREGFTFYANDSMLNHTGYFNYQTGTKVFMGTHSNYRVTGDSLHLFDLEDKQWDDYKIFKLTADTLKFGVAGSVNCYKRIKPAALKTPAFDRIILSTSSCFGSCPITDVGIDSSGNVIFEGVRYTSKDGLYQASVSKAYYRVLQDNFRRMNFDSLQNRYSSNISDDQTVTTTFIKNGKIFKSVYDYPRIAPPLFRWAYVPLEYLYQKVPLKKISYPAYMKGFALMNYSGFVKGDSVVELTQSEAFLLSDLLRNAKIVNRPFEPKFKLPAYFNFNTLRDINTDGRLYTFANNGKAVTVDIGFNFYDVNAKNWQWRKANKYD